MLELHKSKESELTFEIDVRGSKSIPTAFFNLDLPNGLKLGIPGKIIENKVIFNIPPLEPYIEGTESNAVMEVKIDNIVKNPWSDSIIIKEEVTIVAAIIPEKEIKKDQEIVVETKIISKQHKEIVEKKTVVEDKKTNTDPFSKILDFYEDS